MRIHTLWDRHKGHDIYVIGTGPSQKCFPFNFFRGKVTIGLNQAWRYANRDWEPTYCLTAHPELYLDYQRAPRPNAKMRWIVKQKPPLEKLSYDHPEVYVWTSDPHPNESNLDYVRKRVKDKLFQGRGIQQTAMNLAAHMGAASIVLVGVDMTDLGGEHHGHSQHVQFHGLPPADVYAEYRKWTAKVRRVIRDELKIPVLTLSPLLGVGHAQEDYDRIHKELGLSKLPKPKDVSKYKREKADL